MADQEFLASFGVQIDESGVNRLQQALEKNRSLAEELASAFDRARQAADAFFASLSDTAIPELGTGSARVTEEQQGIALPFSLDFTKANKELQAFMKTAGKNLKLTADASAVISAGQSALASLYALFASTVLPLQVSLRTAGSIGAVSAGAASGMAAALSSLPALLNTPSVSPSVTNNASKNVSAPVSINVTVAGSDPEAVGRSVYDVAEQYLLRTMQGAV